MDYNKIKAVIRAKHYNHKERGENCPFFICRTSPLMVSSILKGNLNKYIVSLVKLFHLAGCWKWF